MENIVQPKKGLNTSTLYKTMLALTLVIAAVFGYFYYINKTPFIDNVTPSSQNGAPAFSHFIYGGFGEDQLWKPMGVTTIGDKVFVADTNNYRIQVFTKEGTQLTKFGERGYSKGQFQFPYGVAGDKDGNLLVADSYTGKISTFSPDGKFIGYFGEKEGIDKILKSPSDIKFIEGKLYVADLVKNRVFVFDENGKLALEVGKEYNELQSPNGVTVNPKNGDIYVVDTDNVRVLVYDKAGKLLGQFNGQKQNGNQSPLVNPRGIAINSQGITYVVSNLTHMIYGFDDKFEQLFGFGGLGDGQDKFGLPNGLYIDESGALYITEQANNRVAVYR